MTKLPVLQRSLDTAYQTSFPLRVLQFGTGALLRGLPDYIIHRANMRGDFSGRVMAVGSTGSGRSAALGKQGGLFTHRIEGYQQGAEITRFEVNTAVANAISARDHWEAVLALAKGRSVDIIISNTTEVGLTYQPDDLQASPPASFPAKLTAFLHTRFLNHPDQGCIILPTELVTQNGPKLKDLVLRHAREHGLGPAFMDWIEQGNYFCSTLVDRIVTGAPASEKQARLEGDVGYQDAMLTVSEPYYLWAIEGPDHLKQRLGFVEGDEGVILKGDISPFRERKLRILNGSHTIMVALGHLCGLETVYDCTEDEQMSAFLTSAMFEEIVPSLPVTVHGGADFAEEVMDRFRNPFIHHKLLDITFQYSSKMAMRNVATIERSIRRTGQVPEAMALGFAAYLHFLRPVDEAEGLYFGEWQGNSYPIRDSYAKFWRGKWESYSSGTDWLGSVLAQESIWGQDLNQLAGWRDTVGYYFTVIEGEGPRAALATFLEKRRVQQAD
ncbi:MAG: tagaturonate reductase [Bacteroidota bacterium]